MPQKDNVWALSSDFRLWFLAPVALIGGSFVCNIDPQNYLTQVLWLFGLGTLSIINAIAFDLINMNLSLNISAVTCQEERMKSLNVNMLLALLLEGCEAIVFTMTSWNVMSMVIMDAMENLMWSGIMLMLAGWLVWLVVRRRVLYDMWCHQRHVYLQMTHVRLSRYGERYGDV